MILILILTIVVKSKVFQNKEKKIVFELSKVHTLILVEAQAQDQDQAQAH